MAKLKEKKDSIPSDDLLTKEKFKRYKRQKEFM